MLKPKRALLFSKSYPIGIKVLYCLVMAGWKVSVAVDRRSAALGWSRHVKGTLDLSSSMNLNLRMLGAKVDEYCTKRGISVILADSISAAALLHQLHRYLHTPSYAPEPFQRLCAIHDKWKFYETLHASISLPRTALLRDRSDLNEGVVKWIGCPFILKPLNAEGAQGVVRFEMRTDALTYLATQGPYRCFPLIIQQFIFGEDAGYCVIAQNGRVIVEDMQYRGEGDVRTFCNDYQIAMIGRSIIEKLTYSGPAFIDLRKETITGKLYALECNSRFWTTITANARVGVNYPDVAARIALGAEVPHHDAEATTYHLPGTVARYFRTPGKLLRLSSRDWRGFFQVVTDPLPRLANR